METSLAIRVFVFNSEKRKRIMKILSTITQSTMNAEASVKRVVNVSEIKDEKYQDLFCLCNKYYYQKDLSIAID